MEFIFLEEIACADPDFCEEICQNPRGCTNIAYPMLVNAILPTGKTCTQSMINDVRVHVHT